VTTLRGLVALLILFATPSFSQTLALLGVSSTDAAAPTGSAPLPDSGAGRAQPLRKKLLSVIYAPRRDGRDLRAVIEEKYGHRWLDPHALDRELISEMRGASGGVVRYEPVSEPVVLAEWPPLKKGSYDWERFFRVWENRTDKNAAKGIDFDYERFVRDPRMRIRERVAAGEIDEVWVWAMPFGGMGESIMIGPGAYWCNHQPIEDKGAKRRFVVMGFNYERTVGLAMHSYGHRAESIMDKVYGRSWWPFWKNDWERFTARAKDGKAGGCGTVHFPPNGAKDYDYSNTTKVRSTCTDWESPSTKWQSGPPTETFVSGADWADPDDDNRGWLRWWFAHIPRLPGEHGGKRANWWSYIVEP
jgi:hypothetical protein